MFIQFVNRQQIKRIILC